MITFKTKNKQKKKAKKILRIPHNSRGKPNPRRVSRSIGRGEVVDGRIIMYIGSRMNTLYELVIIIIII